jgi:hypothetical protein
MARQDKTREHVPGVGSYQIDGVFARGGLAYTPSATIGTAEQRPLSAMEHAQFHVPGPGLQHVLNVISRILKHHDAGRHENVYSHSMS